jgi:ectoine hydroxylase-related dioxygenase (phytanoyl-CoA dioxygenase family)
MRKEGLSSRRPRMRLEPHQLLAFERHGHLTQHGLLPAARVRELGRTVDAVYEARKLDAYRQKVRVLFGEEQLAGVEGFGLPALQRLVDGLPEGSVPFMQTFNMWRSCEAIGTLAASEELAGTAAALLGSKRLRLYQDSLFVKRPLDGPTHWHSDLAMAPLDTNAFVTAWLPLQPVPAEKDGGSALIFATGSHRDVALHFWHGDPKEEVDASSRGYVERTTAALELGDATWHHGWTLHCASANRLRTPRRALALSFFADDEGLGRASRLRAPRRTVHCEDAESYQAWLPDVRPGRAARHPLLPLVWDDGPVPAPAPLPSPGPARSAGGGAMAGSEHLRQRPNASPSASRNKAVRGADGRVEKSVKKH